MRILFVCTGNICRSPTAHAITRHLLHQSNKQDKVTVDSAAVTGYHTGEAPDPRAISIAKEFGVEMQDLTARQISHHDYYNYDIIFAMDHGHLLHLTTEKPEDATCEIALFLPYVGMTQWKEVPDPYYGGREAFVAMYQLLEEACINLLHQLDP